MDEGYEVISSGDRVYHSWATQPEGAVLEGVYRGVTPGKFGDEATVVDRAGKLHIFQVTAGLQALIQAGQKPTRSGRPVGRPRVEIDWRKLEGLVARHGINETAANCWDITRQPSIAPNT